MARGRRVRGLTGLESSSLGIDERLLLICCLKGETCSAMIRQH